MNSFGYPTVIPYLHIFVDYICTASDWLCLFISGALLILAIVTVFLGHATFLHLRYFCLPTMLPMNISYHLALLLIHPQKNHHRRWLWLKLIRQWFYPCIYALTITKLRRVRTWTGQHQFAVCIWRMRRTRTYCHRFDTSNNSNTWNKTDYGSTFDVTILRSLFRKWRFTVFKC